jgi:outer membrane protein assembly factor BamD (BamD/ComL family)
MFLKFISSNSFLFSTLLLLSVLLLPLSGCSKSAVYNPSIADLNQKAQAMLEAGDTQGAVNRLEAARDLNPKEPMTNYNLAIAYEKNSDSEKAIALFEEILKSKAYPNGVTEMGLKKNLAITLESQADEYATQAEKLIEQKKASDASALTQQAIDNLEKSKAIFESLKQSDEIKSHLDGLNQQIEKLKNPS